VVLGSIQPLTEMSTTNLPGGKGRPARKADNRLYKMWEPRRLTLWASTAFYRVSFTYGDEALSRSNNLRTGTRVFRMIREASVLQPLEMQTTASVHEVVT
jgi:hypothetical protein